MKTCSKCNTEKSNFCFPKRKLVTKTILGSYCKECHKKYQEIWHQKNKRRLNKENLKYYYDHKEKIIKKQLDYYERNKEYILKRQKKYIKNPEVKKRRRVVINRWTKMKWRTDPIFRIRKILSSRIWHALKSKHVKKTHKTEILLGCSLEVVKNHLQSQFKIGMNWKNYGRWHVDHIIPCASFDLSKLREQKKCFHYTNLQPLWAADNRKKSDKITFPIHPIGLVHS